jgi:hypothetical protein
MFLQENKDVLEVKYKILTKAGSLFGHKHSQESKLKNSLSRASPPNRINIEVNSLELNTTIIYNSRRAAAKALIMGLLCLTM